MYCWKNSPPKASTRNWTQGTIIHTSKGNNKGPRESQCLFARARRYFELIIGFGFETSLRWYADEIVIYERAYTKTWSIDRRTEQSKRMQKLVLSVFQVTQQGPSRMLGSVRKVSRWKVHSGLYIWRGKQPKSIIPCLWPLMGRSGNNTWIAAKFRWCARRKSRQTRNAIAVTRASKRVKTNKLALHSRFLVLLFGGALCTL